MRPTFLATVLSLGTIVSGVAVPDKGKGGDNDDHKCRPDKPERCTTLTVSSVLATITPATTSVDEHDDDHGGDRSTRTRDDDDSSRTFSSYSSAFPFFNSTSGLPTVTVTVYQCNSTIPAASLTSFASLSGASTVSLAIPTSIDDNGGDS